MKQLTDEEKKIVGRYRGRGHGYPFHSDEALLQLDGKNKQFEKELREQGFISVKDRLPELGVSVESKAIDFPEEEPLVVVRVGSYYVIPNTDHWVEIGYWKLPF